MRFQFEQIYDIKHKVRLTRSGLPAGSKNGNTNLVFDFRFVTFAGTAGTTLNSDLTFVPTSVCVFVYLENINNINIIEIELRR